MLLMTLQLSVLTALMLDEAGVAYAKRCPPDLVFSRVSMLSEVWWC